MDVRDVKCWSNLTNSTVRGEGKRLEMKYRRSNSAVLDEIKKYQISNSFPFVIVTY